MDRRAAGAEFSNVFSSDSLYWKEKFYRYSYFITAHGCQMYDDGTIEWDGSTGGYYEELYRTNGTSSPTSRKEITADEIELHRYKGD